MEAPVDWLEVEGIAELVSKLKALYSPSSDYHKYAACRDTDVDIFLDESNKDVCVQLCKNCCVRVECLDDAVRFSDLGIRGGLTEGERMSLANFRRRHRPFLKVDIEG